MTHQQADTPTYGRQTRSGRTLAASWSYSSRTEPSSTGPTSSSPSRESSTAAATLVAQTEGRGTTPRLLLLFCPCSPECVEGTFSEVLQRVASILTCPRVEATSADQT